MSAVYGIDSYGDPVFGDKDQDEYVKTVVLDQDKVNLGLRLEAARRGMPVDTIELVTQLADDQEAQRKEVNQTHKLLGDLMREVQNTRTEFSVHVQTLSGWVQSMANQLAWTLVVTVITLILTLITFFR